MTDTSPLLLPNQTAVPQDYLYNLKPSSVRARSYRASIPSSNKSVCVASDQAILYIPGGCKGTYLDLNQSYLKMTIQNNEAVAGANYFSFDNLATSIIKRIDTFHSGNSIDSLQQYNVLMSYIVDAQLNQSEKFGLSNIYGTSSSINLNLARSGLIVYPGQRVTVCVPLLGAFGLGADKIIPIGQLYDDIRIEVSTASIVEAVCWSAPPPPLPLIHTL